MPAANTNGQPLQKQQLSDEVLLNREFSRGCSCIQSRGTPRYVHLTSTLAVYLVFSFAVFGAEAAE